MEFLKDLGDYAHAAGGINTLLLGPTGTLTWFICQATTTLTSQIRCKALAVLL